MSKTHNNYCGQCIYYFLALQFQYWSETLHLSKASIQPKFSMYHLVQINRYRLPLICILSNDPVPYLHPSLPHVVC